MPDMIPADKIVALAARHVEKARSAMPASKYETIDREAAILNLTVAAELLALIAEPEPMAPPPDEEPLIAPAPWLPVNEAGVPVYPPSHPARTVHASDFGPTSVEPPAQDAFPTVAI